MNWPLIDKRCHDLLVNICDNYQIDPSDRQALAAVCGAILNLENSWNAGTEDPAGFLAACFAGELDAPFYARNKHAEGIALETMYGLMHQVEFSLATVSGEAAISLITEALTRAQDTILVSESIFGTTINNFKLSQSHGGRRIVFLPLHDINAWEESIQTHKPTLVFVESPTNPLANLADVSALSDVILSAKLKQPLRLVVDSTYAPAPMYQPMALGADLVIESATKFFDGQTRVTGGLIATKHQDVYDALFKFRNAKGYNQVSFNALLLAYNARSLSQRITQQSQHAMQVAKWLDNHKKIRRVHYLGLAEHRQHALAKQVFRTGDFGSMLAFELHESEQGDAQSRLKAAQSFVNKTGFAVRANLGAIKTMITHPMSSTHSIARLNEKEIKAAGVTPGLLRLSVGMESPDQLIAALEQALI